ncbi:aldehyde dehydrogenase family protein [Streptomyces sp. NBC_01016]|uniref:aldehyde dehydrogenase family protein n=1 Tax=Streptomyces sp. NBC_01016 TaxID=2903720 RepID=UPI0022517ED1|nr:aldehyde dehydrogenase family protein [Streptomyces sp. NBC_01016]MCX4831347.1 aldehyde dehydrogenase family protein [Streptomyces sp. NBC_01016]
MTASPSPVTDDLGVTGPLINGSWPEKTSLGATDHLNPATGRVNGSVLLSGPQEVDDAVAAARAAQPEWRAMSPDKRRRILQRVEELMLERAGELGRLTTLEIGAPIMMASALAHLCAGWFGYYAGWADKIEGATIPPSPLMVPGLDYTVPEPYGVVGIILTWNGPVMSVGMKIAPALAAGNCVVVKSPDLAPFAVARFGELALEAGLPPGVLHILPGGPEAGDHLVCHPDVDMISFTGGIPTAQKILDAARHTLKPVLLELGGKTASVVFPDADLDAAVAETVRSCMNLSGQGCNLSTRLLVHRDAYEDVVAAAARAAEALTVGDPFERTTALGPVIGPAARDRILGVIEEAAHTSRLVTGGHAVDPGGLPPQVRGGSFVEPTVLADVAEDSDVARHEVFGPVLSVLPFDDEDEAVRLANSTPYGLGSVLYTRDVARVQRVVPRLQAGTVHVNGASGQPPGAPFGGYKHSGHGREGGKEGLYEFLQTKNVFIRA